MTICRDLKGGFCNFGKRLRVFELNSQHPSLPCSWIEVMELNVWIKWNSLWFCPCHYVSFPFTESGLCMNTRGFVSSAYTEQLEDHKEKCTEFDRKCVGLESWTTPLMTPKTWFKGFFGWKPLITGKVCNHDTCHCHSYYYIVSVLSVARLSLWNIMKQTNKRKN